MTNYNPNAYAMDIYVDPFDSLKSRFTNILNQKSSSSQDKSDRESGEESEQETFNPKINQEINIKKRKQASLSPEIDEEISDQEKEDEIFAPTWRLFSSNEPYQPFQEENQVFHKFIPRDPRPQPPPSTHQVQNPNVILNKVANLPIRKVPKSKSIKITHLKPTKQSTLQRPTMITSGDIPELPWELLEITSENTWDEIINTARLLSETIELGYSLAKSLNWQKTKFKGDSPMERARANASPISLQQFDSWYNREMTLPVINWDNMTGDYPTTPKALDNLDRQSQALSYLYNIPSVSRSQMQGWRIAHQKLMPLVSFIVRIANQERAEMVSGCDLNADEMAEYQCLGKCIGVITHAMENRQRIDKNKSKVEEIGRYLDVLRARRKSLSF